MKRFSVMQLAILVLLIAVVGAVACSELFAKDGAADL